MALDDLGRPHECDLLVDPGWMGDAKDAYPNVICEKLLGPQFAFLSPDFTNCLRKKRKDFRAISRVLVFFGGADSQGQTLTVLDAIADDAFSQIDFNIVVGAYNTRLEEIRDRVSYLDNVFFSMPVESLAPMMAEANLFLGAGGTTTWERCFLGLPAIVCSISENQRKQTATLADRGVHFNLGNGSEVNSVMWRSALHSGLTNPVGLERCAKLGMKLVDGMGVERVAHRLTQY